MVVYVNNLVLKLLFFMRSSFVIKITPTKKKIGPVQDQEPQASGPTSKFLFGLSSRALPISVAT